jgi:hypothetical protein
MGMRARRNRVSPAVCGAGRSPIVVTRHDAAEALHDLTVPA